VTGQTRLAEYLTVNVGQQYVSQVNVSVGDFIAGWAVAHCGCHRHGDETTHATDMSDDASKFWLMTASTTTTPYLSYLPACHVVCYLCLS